MEVEFVWKLTPACILVGLIQEKEQTPALWWGSLLNSFVQVGLGLLVLVLACCVALLFAAVHGKTC